MRIIAEVFKTPQGSLLPLLYSVTENGQVDRAVTDTLCDFVSQLFPPADTEFEELLAKVEAGKYVPDNPLLSDFGVNDVNAWLLAPHARNDEICISNENVSDYSIDDGLPQRFSIREFRATLEFWKDFQETTRKKGAVNIVGEKYETLIS